MKVRKIFVETEKKLENKKNDYNNVLCVRRRQLASCFILLGMTARCWASRIIEVRMFITIRKLSMLLYC
jgi:hypothetical protein